MNLNQLPVKQHGQNPTRAVRCVWDHYESRITLKLELRLIGCVHKIHSKKT